MAENADRILHITILELLYKRGIIQDSDYENFHLHHLIDFITIQRNRNTNDFYIGESNAVMLEAIFNSYLKRAKLKKSSI